MRSFSMDLRERAVSAYLAGEGSYAELAERFEVSRSWVKKMVRQYRELGTLQPQTHLCGRKPKLKETHRQQLAKLVDEDPDMTLERLREEVGVDCCLQTIWHALRALRRTYKKDTASCRTGSARCADRPAATSTTGAAA